MNRGELLPNELALKMLNMSGFMKRPECKYGVIFDGYPRTLENVVDYHKIFDDEHHKLNGIIELQIDLNKLIERVEGRRIHTASGRSYHVKFNPPKQEGVDDVTGEPLIQRKDDTKETILKRYEAYNKQTKPILGFYKDNYSSIYRVISSDKPIDQVYNDLKSIINKL